MSSRLLILAYHRVLDGPDPLRPGEITVDCFRSHMRVLARFFRVFPLDRGMAKLRSGTLPRRAVSITFDDGYADNYRNAWPVLEELGLPATLFVATGYLDGGRMWNDTVIEAVRAMPGEGVDLTNLGLGSHKLRSAADQVRAIGSILKQIKYLAPSERDARARELADMAAGELPDDLMLSARQVGELSRSGMAIGGHTVSHPILKEIDTDMARNEIVEGRTKLQQLTGDAVDTFAYPNGRPGVDYDGEHVGLVREAGFDLAVSTRTDLASGSDDPLQLPRFGPWEEPAWKFGARLMKMHFDVRA